MKKEKDKRYGALKLCWRSTVLYFKTSRWAGALEQTLAVFHSLSWSVAIIATQLLFDAIVRASGGEMTFGQVVTPLVILAGVMLFQQVLNGAENFTSDAVENKNIGKYLANLQRKLGRLPAKNFEDTNFLDDVNKARKGAESVGYLAFVCIQMFTFYVVFFVSVGVYLFWLSPILPLVILLAFIPAVLGQIAHIKLFSKLEEANAPLRRRYEFYQRTIVDREFYKETRILGGFRYFHRLFSETLLLVTKKTWQTERKAGIVRLLLNLASFVGLGLSIWMLFNSVMAGDISVGAFAAVLAGLNTIFDIMDEAVTYHLTHAAKSVGKVANYFKILDAQEADGDDGTPDFAKGIKAKGISFTYPGRDAAAINDVSLDIGANETIAVVGENGAGKSTLVRLLVGLYPPDDGTVEIGGLDTKKTRPSAFFGGISGVFQRYQRYKMTVKENVAISNTSNPLNIDNINTTLAEAEFNEEDATLDTMLSPEFDGIDLSGGQWQRLAIARGLYRSNGFIVLDEPTAAIDPIEEERIYNQFKRLSKDKCAIVVTHRLGSAKLADRIVVMDDGQIADIGTHDELIGRKGKYADMWGAQAVWYENRA
ncbi:MAG: ABC transporter ATP-binding protein/permease [Defluviitaleaceae bacterium]|nr:ABC transporter ATP-binding protein/permease [Defluviitaleaceae bacterium]